MGSLLEMSFLQFDQFFTFLITYLDIMHCVNCDRGLLDGVRGLDDDKSFRSSMREVSEDSASPKLSDLR